MPHTESAKKRLRQNEERRLRNKSRTTELKSIEKQIDRALHDGEKDKAAELYKHFAKAIDQASSGSSVHKNTAARKKSRIATRIHAAAIAKPVEAAPKKAPVKKAPAKAKSK